MNRKKEISKKMAKKLIKEISNQYPDIVQHIAKEISFHILYNEIELFASQDDYLFFRYDNLLVPTLQLLRRLSIKEISIPVVRVDLGAVKYLINGADVFRPGITDYQSFKQNNVLIVLNPQDSVLCVGLALLDSDKMTENYPKTVDSKFIIGNVMKFLGGKTNKRKRRTNKRKRINKRRSNKRRYNK